MTTHYSRGSTNSFHGSLISPVGTGAGSADIDLSLSLANLMDIYSRLNVTLFAGSLPYELEIIRLINAFSFDLSQRLKRPDDSSVRIHETISEHRSGTYSLDLIQSG